jgi:flagellar motility protein MotE (MotC chaperone)
MELPELMRDRLEGESVLASVDLGGDDRVVVTPSRVLLYRAEGLLSDESAETFSLDAERLELRSGRRKTTFVLRYVDGERDFTVPSGRASHVLSPVLGGVLRAAGIVEADESVRGAYRFSELTLLVTDRRLVKHVGAAVWDEEYDVAPFADLTGLAFEEGSVGTEVSVEVDGYPQRFKIPNEHAGSVRKTLQNAVFAFHDVDSLAELDATVGVNEETESDELAESGFTEKLGDDDGESEDDRPFADLTAPELDRDRNDCESMTASAEDGEGTLGRTAASGIETDDGGVAGDDDGERPGAESVAVAERLNALEAAVERQSERIEEQRETIERLVEELRRGR